MARKISVTNMKDGSYEILLTGEKPSVVPGAALVGALRNIVGPEGANNLLKKLEETPDYAELNLG